MQSNRDRVPSLSGGCPPPILSRAMTIRCTDCDLDLDTIGERFTVRPELLAGAPLCVACVERRIGRRLHLTDFAGEPSNFTRRGKSMRLRRRIFGERRA